MHEDKMTYHVTISRLRSKLFTGRSLDFSRACNNNDRLTTTTCFVCGHIHGLMTQRKQLRPIVAHLVYEAADPINY